MRATFVLYPRLRLTAVFLLALCLFTQTACIVNTVGGTSYYYYRVQLWRGHQANNNLLSSPTQNIRIYATVNGRILAEGYTDSQGLAILPVPASYNGQTGQIVVEDGFVPSLTRNFVVGQESNTLLVVVYEQLLGQRQFVAAIPTAVPSPTAISSPTAVPTADPATSPLVTGSQAVQAAAPLAGTGGGGLAELPAQQPMLPVFSPTPTATPPALPVYPVYPDISPSDPCHLQGFETTDTYLGWTLGTNTQTDSLLTNRIIPRHNRPTEFSLRQDVTFQQGVSRIRTKIPCIMYPQNMRVELEIIFPLGMQSPMNVASVLQFLHLDDANYYAFALQNDGQFWLAKMVRGQWQQLINASDSNLASPARVVQENRLRIETRYPFLYIYLNDYLVAAIQDQNSQQYAELWLGLEGTPGGERSVEIDNVRVYKLTP